LNKFSPNISNSLYNDEYIKSRERKRKTDSILASLSFSLNIILLIINAAAAYLSRSLSVLSTFIDSAIDCTNGILIFLGAWAIKNTDRFNYPRGRGRLEHIIVLICSIIMGVVNLTLIIQSIQSILDGPINPDINLPTIIILFGGCSMKGILMFFCFKHGTSGSRTIALDMRNDLLTSAVALASAYVGDRIWLYADPLGAISVCTFVALSWFNNAIDSIPMMVGKRAQQENLSRIIRICIEHDSHIKCLDHVMVYHTGEQAIVEVHIVLDENLPLKTTHDIIECLSKKLSLLPFVERAFVHGDYKCDGDWAI
uniref:ZT_dimer domain-containing protein n=1 Tax=Dracunculus medinensis TaxID=318479 RepID=A0A0N4U3P4_DRAME